MELSKFRQEMADKFIAALKEDKIPWHQGWERIERPVNAISGQKYRGINSLWLSYTASEKGYSDPRWCTFKQAQENGWRVKKDEKGTRIEFFSLYDKLSKKNITSQEAEKIREENPDKYNERIRLVSRTYIVFNGSQIAGIPEYIHKEENNILNKNDLINLRDTLIRNMNVNFSEGGDRAFYLPGKDAIHMPPVSAFKTDYDYMSTFLHESGHATGAKERLDRDLTGSFGSEKYAAEELRAEIASAFTAQLTGIPYGQSELMENHKAYIQSWISILDNNPNELFKAIKDAEKISDYLIEKGELLMEHKKLDEPEIEISFTENKLLKEFLASIYSDGKISFALGNAILEYLDEKQHFERDIDEVEVYGYDKTDFKINLVIDGEDFGYDGRFDIGDGREGGNGTVIEHIASYMRERINNNPYNESAEKLAEMQSYLDKVIPVLRAYSVLSYDEQKIFDEFKKQHPIEAVKKYACSEIDDMIKEVTDKVLMVKEAFVSELHSEDEEQECDWKICQIDEKQIENMMLTSQTEELEDALYELKNSPYITNKQRLETLDFVRDVEEKVNAAQNGNKEFGDRKVQTANVSDTKQKMKLHHDKEQKRRRSR